MMDDVYARLSRTGGVVCGRPNADGRLSCDGPLAEVITIATPRGLPERRLAPLPGWRQDKRGVWHRTTQVEDRRARGLAPPRRPPPEKMTYPALPALARCPKCHTVQWLDAERLRVAPVPGVTAPAPRGRFAPPPP